MIKNILIAALVMLPTLALAEPLAIVVNAKSSLSSLSKAEAQQLFSGQSRSAGGVALQPVDLPSGDALRHTFYQELLGRSPDQMRSHWARLIFTGKARPPREASGTAEMQSLISASEDLIGYVPQGRVTDQMRVLMLVN